MKRITDGAFPLRLALLLSLAAAPGAGAAQAATLWNWSCEGPGFEAKGRFATGDTPDSNGFFAIARVSGEANGVAITGLQPAGTAIPGNEGWPVDNLVRARRPELSSGGFGFALADGSFANPFYGARFKPPGFLAVLTDPAHGKWREPRVACKAAKIS